MDGIIPPNLLACLGRTDKSGVTDSFIAASAGEGKPRKFLNRVLFGIFPAKDQSHGQTQKADSCHHSQDGWDAEFTLYNRQDENTEGRSDLRDASSEAASSSNVSRCGGVTSANASASCYGPISRRPLPDDTCVEFPPDSRSALEIAYPFLPSCG